MVNNTGGPAFPTEHTDTSGLYDGMTLRDYFAAKALVALATYVKYHPERAAKYAYEYADAMLAAREQK